MAGPTRRRVLGSACALVLPWGAARAAPEPVDAPTEALRTRLAQSVAQGAAAAPLTHGVLVEQHGQVLAEAYFTADDKPSGAWFSRRVAFDAETLHDMRSITKSVVALLAGVAHGRGLIDPQRPVVDWFPEHAALVTPPWRGVRLAHLLTMTAGFEWDEFGASYGSLANSETRMGLARDPVVHVLSREMVAEPGQRFAYSGGATLLLAQIVERATGRPIDVLAREALFDPLGITHFEWRRHALWGMPLPYSGLRLAPRSMVKLGRLVLDQGREGSRVLVPGTWLDEMQRPHVASTGQGMGYGWQWWVGRVASGPAAGIDWFSGLGNGGQVLMVVPALDATLAVTAGRYNTASGSAPSLRLCRRVIETLAS